MKKAQKLISFERDEMFISFETAIDDVDRPRGRLRLFMNTTDNKRPAYFFVKVPKMLTIAMAMMAGAEADTHIKASGTTGDGESVFRMLRIRTAVGAEYGPGEAGYEFRILNTIGEDGDYNDLFGENVPVIIVPFEEASEIGAALFLECMRWATL
jgi:hypothetical protein